MTDRQLLDLAKRELTPKQLDVFKLWLHGNGTRKIATILEIAEPTAREHLRRAKDRLRPFIEEAA